MTYRTTLIAGAAGGLTINQIDRAAKHLFETDLPRRSRRRLLGWSSLHEHERDYYRWAIRSLVSVAFGLEFNEQRRVGVRHGYSLAGRESPEYRAWISIKGRCLNPKHSNYEDYGGRGITICEQWRKNFPAFLAEVGPRPSRRHSIDRYPDNDGSYEPGNVRWATKKQQQANRRTTLWATLNGEKIPLSEACRRLRLNPNAIWMRISRGASPEAAIENTIRSYQRRGICG